LYLGNGVTQLLQPLLKKDRAHLQSGSGGR
jgi:hypothetical protein